MLILLHSSLFRWCIFRPIFLLQQNHMLYERVESAGGAFPASFNIDPIPEPGAWLLSLAFIPFWMVRLTRTR
jgi:hypothetical protein